MTLDLPPDVDVELEDVVSALGQLVAAVDSELHPGPFRQGLSVLTALDPDDAAATLEAIEEAAQEVTDDGEQLCSVCELRSDRCRRCRRLRGETS